MVFGSCPPLTSTYSNIRFLGAFRALLIAGILLLQIAAGPASAIADANNSLSVQRSSFQFVIDRPGVTVDRYLLKVIVSDSRDGKLTVGFRDAEDLSKPSAMLPAGSMKTSLANVLELMPQDLSYEGKNTSQVFELEFRPKDSYSRQLFQGYIAISFSPDNDSESGASSEIGALSPLVVVPYGLPLTSELGAFKPSDISNLKIYSKERLSFVDSLLPDVPGLINVGPVEASFTVSNPGDLPNFTGLKFSIFQGEEIYVSQTSEKKLMLSGHSETYSFRGVISDVQTNREINVLPNFGVFRVEIEVTSDLSGREVAPIVVERTFVIAPWKEMVAVSAAAIFLVSWILRRKRSLHLENKIAIDPKDQ